MVRDFLLMKTKFIAKKGKILGKVLAVFMTSPTKE